METVEIIDSPSVKSIEHLKTAKQGYIFGASASAQEVKDYLMDQGIECVGIFDNAKEKIGHDFLGLPVLSPLELKDAVKESSRVVIASAYQDAIYSQLVEELQVDSNKVYPYVSSMFAPHFDDESLEYLRQKRSWLASKLADKCSMDYFNQLLAYRSTLDPKVLHGNARQRGFYRYENTQAFPIPGDVIIDLGAFDGDTARYYLDALDGRCRVIAVEANPINFKALLEWSCRKEFAGKIIALNRLVGQFDGKTCMRLKSNSLDPKSNCFEKRGDTVQCKQERLDTLVNSLYLQSVDYIKMDIEGGEEEALLGASKTIQTYYPNMAIAAYHKPNDIVDLIEVIESIDSGYQFFLGHHPMAKYEVEIYCVHSKRV